MGRTSTTTQARQVARARLAEKIEGRRKRELAELEHITDFEAAVVRRAAAEADMAAAVAGLIELGNTVADAADLTEQTETEIRRLRKLAASGGQADDADDADATAAAAPEPDPAGNGGRRAARPGRPSPAGGRAGHPHVRHHYPAGRPSAVAGTGSPPTRPTRLDPVRAAQAVRRPVPTLGRV
jgi:hypothetical protein